MQLQLAAHMPCKPGEWMVPIVELSNDKLLEYWEHPWSNTDSDVPPKYLFRGQGQIYRREWPPDSRSDIVNTYYVDSLIASDFRGVESLIRRYGYKHPLVARLDERLPNLRLLVLYAALWYALNETVCTGHCTPAEVHEIQQVLNEDPQRQFHIFSIAQHYGICTALLDWSASFRVALHMALRSPTPRTGPTDDPVFVYCLDTKLRHDLLSRLRLRNENEQLLVNADLSILRKLTLRPSSQMGWSLYNTENIRQQLILTLEGALIVYKIPRPLPPRIAASFAEDDSRFMGDDPIARCKGRLDPASSGYDPAFARHMQSDWAWPLIEHLSLPQITLKDFGNARMMRMAFGGTCDNSKE